MSPTARLNARRAHWLWSLAAALLVVGCGSEPEPSVPAAGNVFAAEMSREHFGTITVFVRDNVSVVTAVRRVPAERLDGPPSGGTVVADPGTKSLLVSWVGGACRFGPTVTLSGGPTDLLVTVNPDDGPGLPPGIACGDIGLLYGVDISLSEPIDQSALSFELVR